MIKGKVMKLTIKREFMKIRRHIKDYAVEKLAEKVADKVLEEVKSLVNVKNIHHGTDEGTKYIRQWEEYKDRKAKGCANIGCENHNAYDALEGGHVKKVGCCDDSWYITPLCHSCNSATNDDEMTVHEDDLALYNEIKDL